MTESYFYEGWLPNDDDDFSETFAGVAGDMAEATQQRLAEPAARPQRLWEAYGLTTTSIGIWMASTSEYLGMNGMIAPLRGRQVPRESATQAVEQVTERLASDLDSPSSRRAAAYIVNTLSHGDTSSSDTTQPVEEPTYRRSTFSWENCEFEDYPLTITQRLHDVFYTNALPCDCPGRGGAESISERFECALRLQGDKEGPGDDGFCCFDLVIAWNDDTRKDDTHDWTPVQFQFSSQEQHQTVPIVLPDESSGIENNPKPVKLEDFCKLVDVNSELRTRGFRKFIKNELNSPDFYWTQENRYQDLFPQKAPPKILSEALELNVISDKHKIFLAFAISRAFWQYYDSDWMKLEWTLTTLQLLPRPRRRHTDELDLDPPFLSIRKRVITHSTSSEGKTEILPDEAHRVHPHPYIMNLGLLLVQIGSADSDRKSIMKNIRREPGTQRDNGLCADCCALILSDTWPSIDLPEKTQLRYKRVVEKCLPTESAIWRDCHDAVKRREALRDRVVRPLFELFQETKDPDYVTTPAQSQPSSSIAPVLRTDGENQPLLKTSSVLTSEWITNKITDSWLGTYIAEKIVNAKRPKIAIIDTGFDSKARLVDRKLKLRLNMGDGTQRYQHNWKDFWRSASVPEDDDGHGTAILSVVHRIAPFADICVARIAGKDENLRNDPTTTSKNLAEAIKWAADDQKADIISLSLGWEQEQRVDGVRVVSNAISQALSLRGQDLLIFAAASNAGGGRPELFPAKHQTVFSIRATNTKGHHDPNLNPSLPEREKVDKVFGTLGYQVPTLNRRVDIQDKGEITNRDGSSVATAVAAGIAAVVIAYINIADKESQWNNVRTFNGFHNLLYKISTEPEERKRFITLENLKNMRQLETALSGASEES